MQTIKQVQDHFASGAGSVTLTQEEWDAIMDVCRSYAASGLQVSKANTEIARITRIARPLWRACRIVARQMRDCGCSAPRHRISDWERRLRLATEVDWHDLPPAKRGEKPNYR